MTDEQGGVPESPDIHFEPIVKLPLVETKTMEEDEEVLFQMRAKLFRYDMSSENKEWKERGTGDIKILRHTNNNTVRIVMRREKTLKICANHYIRPYMELEPNKTSDRAWVWKTLADFADEEPKPELLAVKFGTAENAQKFKDAFQEAKKLLKMKESDVNSSDTHKSKSASRESDKEEVSFDSSSGEEEEDSGDATEDVKEAVGDYEKESEREKHETVKLNTQLEELSLKDETKCLKDASVSPVSK